MRRSLVRTNQGPSYGLLKFLRRSCQWMFSCATAHHVFLWHYSLYQWRHHSDQERLGDSDEIVVGDGPFTVNHRGPSVRPRGDTLFFPQSESHVQHLLKHSMFASNSVSAFIPPRFACSRGLVRAIDANMTPTEILELFCQQVLFQFIGVDVLLKRIKYQTSPS